MKVKQPAREIEVCDRCRRDGYLEKCVVCGSQYCLTCRGIMVGCIVSPDVCYRCASDGSVQEVVEQYADEMVPILKERKKALKKLKRKVLRARKQEDSNKGI